jgi:broad specificity phosphatase PhoE
MRFNHLKKKLKQPKVIMIRHGKTNFNGTDDTPDRIRGHINIPLNDEGREDAKKAGEKLINKKVIVDEFFSSDLDRTRETAKIIHDTIKSSAPIIYSDALRPWNLGIYEGQVTDDVIDDLNLMVKKPNIVPTNGESFNQFKDKFLTQLIKIINISLKNNSTIVIISHFRNLKTADSWIEAGAKPDLSFNKEVMINDKFKPGELFILPLDEIKKGGAV